MRPSLLPVILLALVACAAPAPAQRSAGATPAEAAAPALPPGFERHPGETVTALALARAGKPNVWTYTWKDAAGRERLLRKEKDLNGDGKVDTWERYEADGALSQVVYDLEFDGRPDVALHYEDGQLVRKEQGFGPEGVPRVSSHYEHGKLVLKARDTNADGTADAWERWEGGALDRVGVDVDGDGQVDRWEAQGAASGDGAAPAAPGQK